MSRKFLFRCNSFDFLRFISVGLVVVLSQLVQGLNIKGEVTKNVIRVPGKVSKLFPVVKSRIWKISKNSIRNENELDEFDQPITETLFDGGKEPLIAINNNFDDAKNSGESDKNLVKRISGEVEGGGGSSSEDLSSWRDLCKTLGEEKIKAFLNTLPLEVLRDVTSLTRKNPELGEKKLVQLFMKRKQADNSKESEGGLELESAEAKSEESSTKSAGKKKNPLNFHIYTPTETKSSENLSERPEIGSLEVPTYQKNLPEPNPINFHIMQDNEIMTNFHEFNRFPKSAEIIEATDSKESPSPAQKSESNVNSGYFLPDITTSAPASIHQNSNRLETDDAQNVMRTNFEAQNPINTFKPNINDFLQPPIDHQSNNLYSGESSSVWLERPSSPEIKGSTKNSQINFSNIKLLPAASDTNGVYVHETNGYTFQGQDHGHGQGQGQEPGTGSEYHIDEKPSSDFGQISDDQLYFSPNSNYHHHHSTVDYNSSPIIHSHPVQEIDHVESFHNNNAFPQSQHIPYSPPQYQQNFNKPSPQIEIISGNLNDNHHYKNYHQNPVQSQKPLEQKPPENSNPSTSHTEHNPSVYHGGWGSNGGPDSDWGPSEIWNALKTYWKKDAKSTAEKVFEVSIGLLSFFAFGGYLLMLIYQVFAVTTAVPFFPLLTPTVPQNPTLFGMLFGRSMESDGSYRFYPNKMMNEKYIEELESIVKIAMGKVKSEWKGVVENIKNDLVN